MKVLGVAILAASVLVGCGGDSPIACTAIAVSSLNVTVLDAASRVPICDATVTGVHRTGTIWGLRRTGDCRYAGPEEVDGVFEVHAQKAGYVPTSFFNVLVTKDECHVIPVQLTIDLPRS